MSQTHPDDLQRELAALREEVRALRARLGAVPTGEAAVIDALLDSAPVGLAFHDRQLRFVRLNETLARINGVPVEATLGRTLTEVDAELGEKVEPILRRVLETEEPVTGQVVAAPTRGGAGHLLVSFYPVRIAGSVVGVGVVVQDMTERVRAEEELRRQSEVLRTVFDHVPVMLALFNPRMQPMMVNREWERVLGWSAEESAGADLLAQLFPDPEERGRVAELILAAERRWADFRTRTRDGRMIDTSWANVRLSDGNSVGIGQDITERKRLEERLIQSQKMETVGRLAGGVAHDFNNLLTVILSHVELLGQAGSLDPLALDDLDQIRLAGQRAAGLTRQLLSFARKQVLQPRLVNLTELSQNLERMLRRLIGADITLVSRLAPGLWPVRADPGQLEQVIVNLVVNARDAMPDGGVLTIATRNTTLDAVGASRVPELAPGDHVVLAVTDTGHGMGPDTLAHLFEPFFTTKPPGQGTGLGLATCHGIIKQSGGQIAVWSEPGQGATFELYFPPVKEGSSSSSSVTAA